MNSQAQGSARNDHDHLITCSGHLLVDLPQQLGEHPARPMRRHQSPADLIGHDYRQASTGLPRLDQVVQLVMELAAIWTAALPVPSRSITAVSQVPRQSIRIAPDTLRSAPASVVSTVLQCAGRRSMIGDPCGPFGIGGRIRHRSGRDVGDLVKFDQQCLGVTGLAGAYASGDQGAVIRAGKVRIDQWGHRL